MWIIDHHCSQRLVLNVILQLHWLAFLSKWLAWQALNHFYCSHFAIYGVFHQNESHDPTSVYLNTTKNLQTTFANFVPALRNYMGLDVTKPVFGVFEKAMLKPVSYKFHRLYLEIWNCTCCKPRYNFQKGNNKGADQTARMRRLVCACVINRSPKTGFLASRPK